MVSCKRVVFLEARGLIAFVCAVFSVKLLLMQTSGRSADDRVIVKTATDRVIVDTTTGEITPIVEVKGKFVFPGGFAFVGLVYISKLRNVKLSADGYRLALLLMEESGYCGICAKPYKDIAAMLGVLPSRISRLLAMLEKVGVAQRIGNRQSGTVMVNPAFCFRGSAKEQHKALEMWAAQRPFGVIMADLKTA
jgi:hypothetical protein